ncbi:uncharacterized protein LOC114579933 isoform X2 [Dendrobium catenatum]|uniref:uncharacterized protein LOC114579933 isoform X2 n=1 Tax=Dendrobium catenatum TaxID=906689 RepID=UPI00109FE3EA|nr:uncharacterized protein LOC114579933 isoform X2 [Dendrobium catenatum]
MYSPFKLTWDDGLAYCPKQRNFLAETEEEEAKALEFCFPLEFFLHPAPETTKAGNYSPSSSLIKIFIFYSRLHRRCIDCTRRFFASFVAVRLRSFDDFPFLSDRKLGHFDRKQQRDLAGCEEYVLLPC